MLDFYEDRNWIWQVCIVPDLIQNILQNIPMCQITVFYVEGLKLSELKGSTGE